ncbi:MAG: N-acetylmuramoyl-L-alanine amidase [Armatimonadetes bacterium]|nr:N-acetylmuramoyl-L-alanine amidase [Armatimonadota bacterium]
MRTVLCWLSLLLAWPAGAEELPIDRSRARDLEPYKPQIRRYSLRHYGEDTWRLEPTCIVLHYTAGANFPWNLVNSTSFAGEPPGLAVHYVVDGRKIWETLPTTVRSRGAYGINHRALNIEMVARDAGDLAGRPETLETSRQLCRYLMDRFGIPKNKIYSHQQVARMDPSVVPEVLDLVNGAPYDKIDPGEANMAAIKKGL